MIATMTDLIENFERGKLEQFHHSDHVRMAFEYLGRYPALEALARFSEALRRFAAVQGKLIFITKPLHGPMCSSFANAWRRAQILGIGTSSRGIILTYLSGRRGY